MSKSPFIWIERKIYQSKAYYELIDRSRYCVPVLLWFLHCRQFEGKSNAKPGRESARPIKNNGEIVFPYSKAEEMFGISRPTFSTVLDHLVELGFIDQTRIGGGSGRDCSLFAISTRWKDYGTPSFIKMKREKSIHAVINSGLKNVVQKRERENKNK